MLATYASVLVIVVASAAIGQGALAVCGRREWSWLALAVGLALVMALCWATVRLPGDGVVSAIAVPIAAIASVAFLHGRAEGLGEALRGGAPVALLALAAASLPFIVEGRFGILGTSFNPDMSQHLLAADRLGDGQSTQLLVQGYPLGPHAIVVALSKGIGVGLVQGFGGLTIAIAVIASLTALAALQDLAPGRRIVAALLAGLPYLAASYLAQGAFKETMQALFVLAFAVGLWQLTRHRAEHGIAPDRLGALPLAVLAAGTVFAYSFPGLVWIAATVAVWGAMEMLRVRGAPGGAAALVRTAWRIGWPALVVFAVLTAPELGRMLDFRRFETFDPDGPGLGNLFGQISPAEVLGIWPSGDFRLAPGEGAVPALAFYAGVALGVVLLAYGLVWWLRRGETALPAALAGAAGIYAAARAGGTPYTAAKAIEVAAPLAALLIVRPLFSFEPDSLRRGSLGAVIRPAAAAAFAVAAAGCSLLALANGPVGPSSYSPALTGLRPEIAAGSTLVLAPRDFLEQQHGVPFIVWELRGGRVCIEPASGGAGRALGPGVEFLITWEDNGRGRVAGVELVRRAGPYLLWRSAAPVRGRSECPLIAVRQARQGSKQGG